MTTTPITTQPSRIRASDEEREEIAKIVQEAGAQGRLTLVETEERLAGIYASKFRQELAQYTTDLPRAEWQSSRRPSPGGFGELRGQWRGPLAVHAAAVVVLSTVIIARWIASGVPYFWPAFPIFWLVVSLVVHARIRAGRWRYRGSRPMAER